MNEIWLLGIALIALYRISGYARAAMMVRRAESFGDVLLSDEVDQPVSFFSRIVLPRGASAWDDERLRAVLLHEGAHVARHDTILGIISDAVCAIYWFHPLAWIAARRARLERERACDDVVLCQGVRPFDYAAALLDVARSVRRRHASAGLAMAERPHLEQRVRAILDSATNRRATRTARTAVFVTVFATAPLLAALTTISIPLPQSGEPDLLGDAIASPFSERIGAAPISVPAIGPDAALIALMQQQTTRVPHSPIDFVADRARWALAQVRDGELVTPLIDALDDSDWRVRAYAAWALGYSGNHRATAPVIALLGDPVWRVRASAAHALSALADPAASDAMHRALSDDAWQVRTPAVQYFAAIGASRELFETMRRDRHLAVRYAAREALQ
jgi:hypothetical protein